MKAPYFLLLLCISVTSNFCYSQNKVDSFTIIKFNSAYYQLANLLKTNGLFKEAVFLSEQPFQQTDSLKNDCYDVIETYTTVLNEKRNGIIAKNYKKSDSINYFSNISIYNSLTQPISLKLNSSSFSLQPFIYDFTDPQGDQDWTNTFVTKLLATHKGNCRSLTYLYKILADELGAKCWLALAPNHIYIRNYSKQIGWYNTELTSGTFPTDAWIAATGYVNTDALRSGVYMDTLSNQQSIGLCIMDLAQGYIKQTNNYTDSFVLKCCNLVLQYHSVNPEALLTKAEALKRMYLKQQGENNPTAQTTYDEMEQTYITLVKLGYREMPYKTYQKWLKTAKQDKEKYQNQRLKATLNKN